MDQTKVSTGRAFIKESWRFYKEQWKGFIVISIIGAAGTLASSLLLMLVSIPLVQNSMKGKLMVVAFFVLAVVISLLFSSYTGFAIIYHIKTGATDLKDTLKTAFWRFWKFLWLMFVITIMIAISYMLFFVPGFVLAIYLTFPAYILIVEEKKVLHCIKESIKRVHGFWFTVFARIIVLALFAFVLALPGIIINFISNEVSGAAYLNVAYSIYNFIITLILTPMGAIYIFRLYEEVSKRKAEDAGAKDGMQGWKKVLLALIPAFVIIIIALALLSAVVYKYKSGAALLPSGPNGLSEEQTKQLEEYAKTLKINPSDLLNQLNEAL